MPETDGDERTPKVPRRIEQIGTLCRWWNLTLEESRSIVDRPRLAAYTPQIVTMLEEMATRLRFCSKLIDRAMEQRSDDQTIG